MARHEGLNEKRKIGKIITVLCFLLFAFVGHVLTHFLLATV